MLDSVIEEVARENRQQQAREFVSYARSIPFKCSFSLNILEGMSPCFDEYALLAEKWHLDEDYPDPDGVPCELACRFILAVNDIRY